jgi:hypothetical protein
MSKAVNPFACPVSAHMSMKCNSPSCILQSSNSACINTTVYWILYRRTIRIHMKTLNVLQNLKKKVRHTPISAPSPLRPEMSTFEAKSCRIVSLPYTASCLLCRSSSISTTPLALLLPPPPTSDLGTISSATADSPTPSLLHDSVTAVLGSLRSLRFVVSIYREPLHRATITSKRIKSQKHPAPRTGNGVRENGSNNRNGNQRGAVRLTSGGDRSGG